jgi:hypothetical protein
MNGLTFYSFAQTSQGPPTIVDVCLDAMEKGMLPVVAEQWGYCLWEYFTLTTDQWVRVCALLQRHRLPPRLLWRIKTRVHWTRWTASTRGCLVSSDPDAVAALSRIEFLWQDLDAVHAWVNCRPYSCDSVEWVEGEVWRRRWWLTGLRRAWLLAALFPRR